MSAVLHSDMNSFYASVECLYHPEIRNKPVVVGGDPEKRHGIVLTKNTIAKKYKIKTGETIQEACRKCPDLVVLKPSYDKYKVFSDMAREIYYEYTDKVEAFGIDENWLGLNDPNVTIKDAEHIAQEIKERIKREIGVSVSIGVSFGKVFAKLGSDYKKPDAITVISRENYKEVVWPLPAGDLLYVGPQTAKKLKRYCISTIGDLANTSTDFLHTHLGKIGIMLWRMANGYDSSPVMDIAYTDPIKSIGNSKTTVKDLTTENDIKITLYRLSESVAMRLRESGYICNTVQVGIRDKNLVSFERQAKIGIPCADSGEIFKTAFMLVMRNLPNEPIRSLGVRACQLSKGDIRQLSVFEEVWQTEKHEQAEIAIDGIRERFGVNSVKRGILLTDKQLADMEFGSPTPVAFLK